jgi:anion-transporting  ArsA/GET3 family ATPase
VSSVLDRRLILVAGKGGVGRSTVAASIAAACARRGRKTLFFQNSPSDRISDLFGAEVGPEIAKVGENLYAVNTNPAMAIEEYGLMILRFRRVYKLVFENRLTKHFLRAIPGLDDYAILGKAWYHTEETTSGKPVWDTLVFDLPASGHSMSMLKIPTAITEVVPEGPLKRDARTVNELLRDGSRTAMVMVTLAEEMPANEATELASSMKELGIAVSHLVINQFFSEPFEDGSPASAVVDALNVSSDLPAGLANLTEQVDLARQRNTLNARYSVQIEQAIGAPMTTLPMLFVPELGPEQLGELSGRLEADLVS